ncbi:MAG: hypothetical protein HN413_13700 [Chloroflexi bacterium]|jgi:hypothetical protein|nr:hypothetical protein [Chloroflexota bacterium]
MIDRDRIKKRAVLIRPMLLPLILYIGFLLFAVSWVPKHEVSSWRYLIVMLPMLPGVTLALGLVRISSKLDELERKIILESIAFSFILTLIILIGQGLLGLVGFPQLGDAAIAALMCFLLVIGKFWSNWRHR